jgi:hypothetical protein
MDQTVVAVHALLFIALARIEDGFVGQHRSAFVRHFQQVSMTFAALGVVDIFVGALSVLFVVVLGRVYDEVHDHVLYSVIRLGIEELKGIFRSRKVTVHAVGHHPLGVVDMG